MSNLPNELIDEILTRLPPKSMMRFKSVSHAWNKKLGSVEFVKYHEDRRKKDSKKVMIYRSSYLCEAYSFSLNNGTVKSVQLNFGNCKILGACDGLLLLLVAYAYRDDVEKLFIWNPYTEVCRDLLIPGDIYVDFYSRFGFGCASSLDKKNHHNFKVLFIRNKAWDAHQATQSCEVALYTTRTNSCERLKNIPYEANEDDLVLLDVKLHFLVQKLTTKMILAFDIEDEEFKKIPLPDFDARWWHSMAELNGNLCVVSLNKQYERMWVMKEYGVKESWTNMFCLNLAYIGHLRTDLNPLHLYDNNWILLDADYWEVEYIYSKSNLLLINCDSENVKAKTLNLDGVPRLYQTVAFEETLLSPNTI